MFPVSLDCLFLIAPSVFSNVYLSCVPNVSSFFGLSVFDCPFGKINKRYRIPKGQSNMDNPKKLATLGTQDK
jgi:hypothetical protein